MKKLFQNGLLFFFSIAVAILLAEAVCRIIPLSNDSDPTYKLAHEVLPFVMKPNSESISIHGHVLKINSHGLRDFEYSYEKEKGVFRILVLGDSVTFAFGNDMEAGYSKVLERQLNEIVEKKYSKVEVINAAHNGYNTFDEYNYLRLYGLKYSPDLLVVGVTYADFTTQSMNIIIKDGVDSRPGSFWLNIPTWVKKTLRQSHLYIAIGWVRANRGFSIKDPTAHPVPSENNETLIKTKDNFDKITALASKEKIPLYFISIPGRGEVLLKSYLHPQFIQHLRTLENEGKGYFIDSLDGFTSHSDRLDDLYALKDSSHPSAEGHQILGNYLFKRISPIVSK
ncbi:SGNH/GDSL hydrolase family protein [Mariprofundus sp. NF]|uniref:SGNH/GDSL hydrolase family protein n=1 Tax=Mariprofundus sp. NF TaxID=2608716 RepID=UPI0015A02BCF|nr:SGNH/GDSL hydrolase family protein [Mariprofundus sp. NF]NWF39491.1 SGNH/GDSL hydrolase family protein [Mariprofundus sp. NF]